MDEPVSRCFANAFWRRCDRYDLSTEDAEEPFFRDDMRVLVYCVVGQLWQEIVAQGYQGSRSSIYRALKGFRAALGPWTASPKVTRPKRCALSPRQGMWLLAQSREKLKEEERAVRAALENAHADIAEATTLAERFQALLRERDAAALEGWLEDASESGIGPFKHFAASLRRDEAAVRAALAQPWSNGQLEAQVNRLKLIKRIGYGRAKFDLLRRRVLYAA